MTGVSFVIPVRNGAACIRETIASVLAQRDGRPMEVIVVDDRSADGSFELLKELAERWPLQLIRADGRGAAAALNLGIRRAQHPVVCQVDQDVVLGSGWAARLADELRDPTVGAAQGLFETDPHAGLFARVMGRDLEDRYAAMGDRIDHVCTGNSAYRTEALRRVGLFDENLGYGYDNDMSYRLQLAGYRLAFCRDARSTHRWREGITEYLRQQYGFGYCRLDLLAKHPRRVGGDSVSPLSMMLHPVVMSAAAISVVAGLALGRAVSRPMLLLGAFLVGLLILERSARGARAAWRFRDRAPLLFPLVHALRDLVWVGAIVVWSTRRLLGISVSPSDSMRPRAGGLPSLLGEPPQTRWRARSDSVLAVIPAHNEAFNLPVVVAEIRAYSRGIDVLVVDDGSTDGTATVVRQLGVPWLRLPHRMGIGAAMRVALRYAATHDYTAVVRLDGDGQHGPGDIPRLLQPLRSGDADVVLGSRDARPGEAHVTAGKVLRRLLAACLTALTGRRVTDPTCGFCALGPRAVRILAEHHPTGYPEAELRLFLSRNGLRMVEVSVATRSRLSGKTSLTPARVAVAAARVLLAMCIVPFQRAVPDLAHD